MIKTIIFAKDNLDDYVATDPGDVSESILSDTWVTLFACILLGLMILAYLIPYIIEFINDVREAVNEEINMDSATRKKRLYQSDVVEGKLIFYAFSKHHYKRIKIDVRNLSKTTVQELRDRIQFPLLNLYVDALECERAEKVFKSHSEYILTVAEDLRTAIKQCSSEEMEQKMCSRLHILGRTINSINEEVLYALQLNDYQESVEKELNVQAYEPFTLTDSMNKLL